MGYENAPYTETPFDSIAVTAVNTAMLLSRSGIVPFAEIAAAAQSIWCAEHAVPPESIDVRTNAPGIEVRYRLGSLLTRQATQVLDIAAGLSPRGITCAVEHPDRTYVELELPIISRLKRRVFESIAGAEIPRDPPANWHQVEGSALDLSAREQAAHYFNPAKPLAITSEGLLHYLPHDQKAQVARNIAVLLRANPESAWYTDMPLWKGITDKDSAMAVTTSNQTGISVASNRFETHAEVESFLGQCGLEVRDRHWYTEPSLVDQLSSLKNVGLSRQAFIEINQPWSMYEITAAH